MDTQALLRNSFLNLRSLGFRGAHEMEYRFCSALDLLSMRRRFFQEIGFGSNFPLLEFSARV